MAVLAVLTVMAQPKAEAALTITRALALGASSQDGSFVSKGHAAYDPVNQVYLIVWSQFNEKTYGQFIAKSGTSIGAPFLISTATTNFARVVYGTEGFLVVYGKNVAATLDDQRWGRLVTYVNGAAQMTAETMLCTAYLTTDSDNGMAYAGGGQYLITYWRIVNGLHYTFLVGFKNGLVNIPETRISTNASSYNQDVPEIACDTQRDRCLIVGKAWKDPVSTTNSGAWGRFVTASTGVPQTDLFYLDFSVGRKEEQKVAFSPTSSRFVVAWTRSRRTVVVKRLYSDLSADATATVVIDGGTTQQYGQQSLNYNSSSNSFAIAVKDGSDPAAQHFAIELNGNGEATGAPLRLSTIGTTGDGYPALVPNAPDSQFLAFHSVNWRYLYTGLVAATNPGGGGGGGTPDPAMNLDVPTANQVVAGTFTVSGWAIDRGAASGTGVSAVRIYAAGDSGNDPEFLLGQAAYGGARSDIGTTYGSQFTNSGFSFTATIATGGRYRIRAEAYSTVSGTWNQSDNAIIGVSQASVSIGSPLQNASVSNYFSVAGWAADAGSASGTGIDVVAIYGYPNPGSGAAPQLLAIAPYGYSRPDVATALGDARFTNTGFNATVGNLLPGTYQLVVFAHAAASNTWASASRIITAGRGRTIVVDSPVNFANVSSGFLIRGWAANLASTSGTGVNLIQIWAYPATGAAPIFLGTATYGVTRTDVATAFGTQFRNSGYTLTTNPLPSGDYVVVVFARNSVTGVFDNAKTVGITIP